MQQNQRMWCALVGLSAAACSGNYTQLTADTPVTHAETAAQPSAAPDDVQGTAAVALQPSAAARGVAGAPAETSADAPEVYRGTRRRAPAGGSSASGSGGSAAGRGGTGGSGGTNSSAGGSGGTNSSAGGSGGTGNEGSSSSGVTTYGTLYQGGQFHLGPVDYEETHFHNACAPGSKYASNIRALEGNLLTGLWNGIPNTAELWDACIYVQTARGKSAILRVVTFGDTSQNSIDTSPEAFALLDSGEYPRSMTWQLAKCPDTGKVVYEFQTGSSQWWTSLWVRNARLPITKVEVQSPNHDYVSLRRESDGTLNDDGGFGAGHFSIRLTAIDGQQIVDEFDWPASGIAGQMLTGAGNFK